MTCIAIFQSNIITRKYKQTFNINNVIITIYDYNELYYNKYKNYFLYLLYDNKINLLSKYF